MSVEEWVAEFERQQREAQIARQRDTKQAAVRNFLLTVLISAVTFAYLLFRDMSLGGMLVLLGFIAVSALSWVWEAHTLRKISA